ncbi:MAG TPA: ABC transporter ATP-binding protein [Thermoanaerobaculia bacterium]|jgi:putative ABC transport system ATP-binding protein|nr:ABC transporter ATP-binding protein [Thermoanaerobaculia bacterium]
MSESHTGPWVRLEGASRRHGEVVALDALDLTVAAGEWLSVTGPSGSGKTTLLNLLAGLDRPTGGAVWVRGEEVSTLTGAALARYRRERVGLVFQEFHLIPYLSALDNVMLAQHVHSLADRGQATAALERVGLGHRLRHLPAEMSGGEKQRVCIARALINHPALLLADEPTGNLDAANEAQVLELLAELHGDGQTLVVVTHNPQVAARGDRTLRLEHGQAAARRPGGVEPAATAELLRRQRLAEVLHARTANGATPPPCGALPPVASEHAAAVAALLGDPQCCPHGEPIPAPEPGSLAIRSDDAPP